jgi:hypothetical protein
MEVNGQLYATAAVPQGKMHRYPLNMRQGGPKSRYERFMEEKSLLPLPGIKPRFFGVQPVA